jgi:hypothetical protein
MTTQEFMKKLNKININDFPFKWKIAFLAQDYNGRIHLFNKKPIPYTQIYFKNEYIFWERTDAVPNSDIEFISDELGTFDDYHNKIIMLENFNTKNISKMKKTVMSI